MCVDKLPGEETKSPEGISHQWPENDIPPAPRKIPTELKIHDDTRIDDYYWLKDKENPETLEYLQAENFYLETMMAGAKNLQDELFIEMKGRIKETDESVPVYKKGYYYYTRFEEGKQYYKYCRKKETLNAPEELLLDVNEMAVGYAYFAVSGFSVSPDNHFLAYGEDRVGRRQYTIYIKDLRTGDTLRDLLYPTSGHAVWASDNKTLFYTEKNQLTLLSENIRKHTLGDTPANDQVVYHENDKSNYIGVGKTRSGCYIVITSSATLSSEVLFLDADQPDGHFRKFQERISDVLYKVDHWNDRFIIVTNWEAKNFRVMETALQETNRENWKELIPHRDDVLVQSAEPFKDYLVITERRSGLVHVRIRNAHAEEHYLDFGEPSYAAFTGGNPEYHTSSLRYNYTSLTTPMSTFEYDLKSREKKLMKQQEVQGGYEAEQYRTERIYATAKDGAKIPLSIVYKNACAKDGNAPLLLYGYGAYGLSVDASFSSARLSLLNRGFAFAIAHIRGGQELGRAWYEEGKLMKKRNTFSDFIDCAEHLLREKYTSPKHLYAMGGSAGGLLIGAVATMRPDLWNGVIASVPFVDVVTTMLDESIPLTTNEFDEWGNPKNKDVYEYLKSYSPYDNVGTHYPNMLVTTGLHDSQVQYFEPAKWVAKIRENKADQNVLLFHINMTAGHGGASGRFEYLKEIALEYAFLLTLERT